MTDLRAAANKLLGFVVDYKGGLVDVSVRDKIESILREVVQDARDKASEAKFEAVIMAARSEMREEAAKIVDNHCLLHRDYETGTDDMIPCELPKRIRALKP